MDKRQTILIVDDVPDDIAVLEEILKRDYHVKVATGGEDALAIARGPNPPDLVLLDIIMPGMDGFEVCRALKQEIGGATIPVIFLTAKVMPEDEKAGFELGAVDYIRKPVDPDIVRTRVKSHLEQKDKILRLSEMKYRRLFETAQDGIMIVDVATGAILDFNPSLAVLLGASQETFLGRKMGDLEFLRTILSQREGMPESMRDKYVRYRDLPLETLDGRKIYIEFVSKTYQVDHREILQVNIREITDLVAAERERDRLAARLSHYLSTSPTITYSIAIRGGNSVWEWVSENVSEVLGYTSEEALEPNWWFNKVNTYDRASAIGIIVELAKSGTASREYRFSRKDHAIVWLHDEMRQVSDEDGGLEIVGTLTDITARKKAEEEIHLKSSALDIAANAMVITDRGGRIKWANPAFCALTGYSADEILGRIPGELVHSGRQDDVFYHELWDSILSGRAWSGRLVNRRKNGELYDEEMTITPVLDDSLKISHFIAIKNDITESVLARKRLEDALRQKGDLLREVHHRVNNNMQVIISLLNVSVQEIGDPSLQAKLADITQRIHVIATIHEQFYGSDDISEIDFAVYLQQLADRMGVAYRGTMKSIEISCPAGQAYLHLEQAIPVGLIVEELVMNAIKHAFPEPRESDRIRVVQTLSEEGELAIEVRDNGVGIGPDVELREARTMGMILIGTLADQVGAKVSIVRDGGTVATLRLKLPSAGV